MIATGRGFSMRSVTMARELNAGDHLLRWMLSAVTSRQCEHGWKTTVLIMR